MAVLVLLNLTTNTRLTEWYECQQAGWDKFLPRKRPSSLVTDKSLKRWQHFITRTGMIMSLQTSRRRNHPSYVSDWLEKKKNHTFPFSYQVKLVWAKLSTTMSLYCLLIGFCGINICLKYFRVIKSFSHNKYLNGSVSFAKQLQATLQQEFGFDPTILQDWTEVLRDQCVKTQTPHQEQWRWLTKSKLLNLGPVM